MQMIELPYSLIIEATDEPDFFGFYSEELEGFTGIGHSIEDCLYKAKHGMKEHVAELKESGLPIPRVNPNPRIVIQNQQDSNRTTASHTETALQEAWEEPTEAAFNHA